MNISPSRILKLSIVFAGLAGIMSEYLLSTIATYLLGDAVKQWTLIISFMLLAMGVGSGVSSLIKERLIDVFIFVEILLSFFISISVISGYLVISYVGFRYLVLYSLSFMIGFLIGYEIPLATRINNSYEELRINIAEIMKRDYIGAFLGGILFIFVAIPYVGLVYTPVVLALLNFFIALLLLYAFKNLITYKKSLLAACGILFLIIITVFIKSEDILFHQEQKLYMDKIVYYEQTPYQRIVVTEWQEDYWLYLNGNQQFSSFDEERYHEPFVHPAMLLANKAKKVLVLGGGDGLAVREILKHKNIEEVTLVDLDPAVTTLAKENTIFTNLNNNSLNDKRVTVMNEDGFTYLEQSRNKFDVIFIDLPDPKSIDLSRLYSYEFYLICKAHLTEGGMLVTQSISPVFSRQSFFCILNTLKEAGFSTIPYHANIPTMGEWGWIVSAKQEHLSQEALKDVFLHLDLKGIELNFLNNETLQAMAIFWKNAFEGLETVEINRLLKPVIFSYYKNDRWDLY
ncbi:MAG: polyamine aminopropyltransferase [Nitrospinae bacterium]|nr:polyamine aminopropyltransferase [Nitrospinota bacterium]